MIREQPQKMPAAVWHVALHGHNLCTEYGSSSCGGSRACPPRCYAPWLHTGSVIGICCLYGPLALAGCQSCHLQEPKVGFTLKWSLKRATLTNSRACNHPFVPRPAVYTLDEMSFIPTLHACGQA